MSGTEDIWAFGGVQTPYQEARVVIVPVAYDLTTSYGPGARFGPRALLNASANVELFDDELGFSPTDVGVHTSDIIEQIVAGPERMIEAVADAIGGVLDDGRFPVLVGGDHSLSVGAFRALATREKSLTILQLDAHADLREEYQGSPFSHACVMARARELFPCVQVGIRSISAPEFERVQRERLPLFPARRCHDDREAVVREAISCLGQRIYLTIDLDVLDPSILPSTGTPEPGGFRWDEICWFVRELTKGREVVGFDLMELAPIPGLHAPDFMAAKLLNKVLGLTCPPEGVA